MTEGFMGPSTVSRRRNQQGLQWSLQRFEETQKLAAALDRLNIRYSWHKVVPFVGELVPEPELHNPFAVVMSGSYTLWRYPEAKLPNDGRDWFIRPVADSKEPAGAVRAVKDIRDTARKVMALDLNDMPVGSLRPETLVMLSPPIRITKEWRIWIVRGVVSTYSLYKEGARVACRHEIDEDALEFAQTLAGLNKHYSPAYVMDICRTEDGLRRLETNCINAVGFYAADLPRLAAETEGMA